MSEIKITCATQASSIKAEDWNFTLATATRGVITAEEWRSTFAIDSDLALGKVFYNNKISATGAQRLFKCPYCDCLSDTPGICKNCGGVKEIWYG